jgi:hypothetical protein
MENRVELTCTKDKDNFYEFNAYYIDSKGRLVDTFTFRYKTSKKIVKDYVLDAFAYGLTHVINYMKKVNLTAKSADERVNLITITDDYVAHCLKHWIGPMEPFSDITAKEFIEIVHVEDLAEHIMQTANDEVAAVLAI